jgi:spermidine synthase
MGILMHRLARHVKMLYHNAMWNQVIFFFLNGVGTLIIETAWLKKQLALFGSTPESYGSVLFVYFLGISAGSWYFGKRSGESVSRRTLYANFTTALLLSLVLPLFLLEWVSLPVDLIYLHPIFYKVFIWLVAIVAIFPACFFLGGFFPLIAATVDRRNFVFLYGVQAFGTVFGIYLGSFFLPRLFRHLHHRDRRQYRVAVLPQQHP